MATEVSGLIRGFQTRRLQTQPGDDQLFQSRSGARSPKPAALFAMPVAPAMVAQAAAVRRPRAPVRRRSRAIWPLAILALGVIGFFAIAYGPFGAHDQDDPAPAFAVPTLPAPPPPAPATALKVEPIAQPAPAPLPAAVPDPAPAAAEPVAAAATSPAAVAHHRVHAKKAKAKPKKVAIAKRAPAAAAAVAEPATEQPAPSPAKPARHAAQADDNENPL